MGVVYKITSPSGRAYVGQSKQRFLSKRMGGHRHDALGEGRDKCPRLDEAIRKYGWQAMRVEIIWSGPNEELNAQEKKWIAECNTLHPNGYNMTPGGQWETGDPKGWSEETRALLSEQKKAEWASGHFSNGKGPHTEQAQANLLATLAAKTEQRLETLSGKELHVARRNLVTGKRKAIKDRHKREASRDPEAWSQWQANEAKMTADERKSLRMAQKRAAKMATMDPVEAALWMHRVRRSAMHTAAKRGIDFATLERWYPNVLTMQEIRALQRNKGVWRRA